MAEAPDALDPISALREHHRTAQRAQAVNQAKATVVPDINALGLGFHWKTHWKIHWKLRETMGNPPYFDIFYMFHGKIRGFRFCLTQIPLTI